jgi:N-acetylglucosaminyl-diphospho-decaprenol L-rhamnosyltransferase
MEGPVEELSDVLSSADWTIVTVTYNSAEHLRAFWASGPPGDARWLVVDNNSTDDSVTVAKQLGAEVISLDENLGFSAANNVGLRLVETTWVAFVNPDVRVAGGEDLVRLARVARANRGFVAPQLLNLDGSEQPNARGLPHPLSKLAHRSVRLPGVDVLDYARSGFKAPVYAAWVMGAAFGGATRDFHEIGEWDDRFFLYYEDHDIGLRAWQKGKPVVVDPSVRWFHGWQRETTRLKFTPWGHELRSAILFYRRYPRLLTTRTAGASPAFKEIQRYLWQAARDWG